jgi:hypothetical protein
MVPFQMFPEGTVLGNGTGPVVRLDQAAGQPLQLRLSIDRMMERHILDVSVWGSTDGSHWGSFPLAVFPHRYYCGVYQNLLDLSNHPQVRYLRINYELKRLEPNATCRPVHFSITAEMAPELVFAAGSAF